MRIKDVIASLAQAAPGTEQEPEARYFRDLFEASPIPAELFNRAALLNLYRHYLNDNRPKGSCCLILSDLSPAILEAAQLRTRPNTFCQITAADQDGAQIREALAQFVEQSADHHCAGLYIDVSRLAAADAIWRLKVCHETISRKFGTALTVLALTAPGLELPAGSTFDRMQPFPFAHDDFTAWFLP